MPVAGPGRGEQAGEASRTGNDPVRRPEQSAAERRIALLVFAVSFGYLCLFRRFTALDPDEGIILQGAQRILHGQVLYRDFFSYFTPGSYYWLALLFKLFGSSMLVARTAVAVYGGLLSVFTYLVARRVCSRWSALLAAYLVTITGLPWRFLAIHNWDSTLLACAAVYCAVRWVEALAGDPSPGLRPPSPGGRGPIIQPPVIQPRAGCAWALATGSFASLTVLFEQSKGAGLVLGLGAGFLLVGARLAVPWTGRAGAEQGGASPAPTGRFAGRRNWMALAVGFAWPFALTFAYFGAQHALPQMLADWLWPLHHYSRANSVPYGTQNWSDSARHNMFGSGPWMARATALAAVSPAFVIPVLPLVAPILLAYWMREARRGRLEPARARYYVLACSSLIGVLVSLLIVRPDNNHFAYVVPLLYLVLAWVFDGSDIRTGIFRSIRPAVTVGVVLTFTALGMAFLVANRAARSIVQTRRGTLRAAERDTVLEYTQARVPAGSEIVVYPYLPLYYYLSATYSPTRFEYLQPGMHSRQEDEEAIREIEADGTWVVLFEPGFDEKIAASWPNTPLGSIANDPVGDYLLERYRSCKVLRSGSGWPFLFMVRKDLGCPAD